MTTRRLSTKRSALEGTWSGAGNPPCARATQAVLRPARIASMVSQKYLARQSRRQVTLSLLARQTHQCSRKSWRRRTARGIAAVGEMNTGGHISPVPRPHSDG